MLQAQICGPYGGCASQFQGIWDDVTDFAEDAYDTAKDAYNAGKDVYNTVENIVDSAKGYVNATQSAAQTACGIVGSSAAQAGTNLLTQLINNKYTQGAASGVAKAQSICNQTSGTKSVSPTALKTAAAAIATGMKPSAVMIPGGIQWKSSKDGLWHYAVPKGSTQALQSAMAALKSAGLGGAFIPPAWSHTAQFAPPWAAPNVRAYYGRRYNWHSVNTSDAPYLTTQGLSGGGTHVEVGAGMNALPAFQQIPEEAGKDAVTSPFWKKWWFWALVGGGTLAAGSTAYYVLRK